MPHSGVVQAQAALIRSAKGPVAAGAGAGAGVVGAGVGAGVAAGTGVAAGALAAGLVSGALGASDDPPQATKVDIPNNKATNKCFFIVISSPFFN